MKETEGIIAVRSLFVVLCLVLLMDEETDSEICLTQFDGVHRTFGLGVRLISVQT